MREAHVFVCGKKAAIFTEIEKNKSYQLTYLPGYEGPNISLTLPKRQESYEFDSFPPFFDGLLPEGPQLEGLLRLQKIDRTDYFAQLLSVGHDLVGAVSVEEKVFS
jgi:serine/threonine-protein kinase HipA